MLNYLAVLSKSVSCMMLWTIESVCLNFSDSSFAEQIFVDPEEEEVLHIKN